MEGREKQRNKGRKEMKTLSIRQKKPLNEALLKKKKKTQFFTEVLKP